jgi:ribosomal protein S12 methylthiotransferase accessory factor
MKLEKAHLNRRIELLRGIYDDDLDRQLQAVGRLYNRTLGPVTAINIYHPEAQDLAIYSSSCEHVPFGQLVRDATIKVGVADTVHVPGGGKGRSLEQAFLGGLGEAAERLLAILHFGRVVDQLIFSTYRRLVSEGRRALGPLDLPLFAEEQYAQPDFSYERFREDTPLAWLEGTDLTNGEKVLVPAQLMLIYYRHARGEAHIGYPTTGGLAFHCRRRRAILHGFYEYIERDAINLRWYRRIAPPRVDLDLDVLLAASPAQSLRFTSPTFQDVGVFLATVDIPIPIFTAIALDPGRAERGFLGGGGAWSGRDRALTQALYELGQSRTALKFYRPSGLKNISAASRVEEMSDFFDAAVFYGYAENVQLMAWYTAATSEVAWDDTPSREWSDEDDEYDWAMDLARAAGLTPIAFDFGAACWEGTYVTRVFIPQLTQACVPSTPYLGHPRFHAPIETATCKDDPKTFAELNPYPVPFP